MTAFYYFCGHEQWQPETLVEHAVAAEAAGFDGLLVSEHFHPWVDDVGASGFAFATLGAMARATHRVRLATGVTTPLFRCHPAVVAQAAATIDRLSGGRFDLGVGTGENINEAPVGLPFPPYGERARRLAEALEIMRRLLDGEKVTFPGRYYQTDLHPETRIGDAAAYGYNPLKCRASSMRLAARMNAAVRSVMRACSAASHKALKALPMMLSSRPLTSSSDQKKLEMSCTHSK